MRTAPLFVLAFSIALSACAGEGAVEDVVPPPVVRPIVKPPVAAVPAPQRPLGNWEDWPATPGNWTYRTDARGSIGLFGQNGGNAVFVVRCDRAMRQIFISVPGALPEGESFPLSIRTTTAMKVYQAGTSNEAPAYVAVGVSPNDPHLDAMAFSRGHFLAELRGGRPLTIPSWPELTRVIEDCRAA